MLLIDQEHLETPVFRGAHMIEEKRKLEGLYEKNKTELIKLITEKANEL